MVLVSCPNNFRESQIIGRFLTGQKERVVILTFMLSKDQLYSKYYEDSKDRVFIDCKKNQKIL